MRRTHGSRHIRWCLTSLLFLLCASSPILAEAYGTIECMGVIADVPDGYRPDQLGRVRAFLMEGEERKPVHDLVRVGSTNTFATSLFWLKPATQYTVEVEFLDKAGKAIGRSTHTGRTRKEPTVPKAASEIHVHPGTPNAVRNALSRARAGTTVYLHSGVYYEGDIAISSSGRAGQPIVVRRFKDEVPILDGSDLALLDPAVWKGSGDGVYTHAFSGPCFNASIEHKTTGVRDRLFPVTSVANVRARAFKGKSYRERHFKGGFHADGKALHLSLADGQLSDYRIHISRSTRAFSIVGQSHITFDGIELRHYGKGSFGAAFFLQNSSDLLFQRCRIYFNNTGLWIKGNSHRNVVQDNEFFDKVTGWSWRAVKSGYDSHVETGGVYVEGTYGGRGLVIRRNKFHGMFDGLKVAPHSRISGRTSETDVYQNTITWIGDDFIETDGYSRNVRIFDNVMDRSMSGISLAQALDGPTFILYNVIANCGMVPGCTEGGFEGYPFKTNGGPKPDVGSGEVFFYHNTAFTTDPEARAILIKRAKSRKLTFRNNIWCGRKTGFRSWQASLSPVDMDYDNIYTTGGPVAWIGKKRYGSLGSVRSGLGLLMHGCSVAPRFVNEAKLDFRLSPGSPCIDRGIALPGINDNRIVGKAPDLGALENGLGKSSAMAASRKRGGPKANPLSPKSSGSDPKALRESRTAIRNAAVKIRDSFREHIIAGVKEGRRKRVYVDVGGALMRGRIIRADSDRIVIALSGGDVPILWDTLSDQRFAGIAAKYAGENSDARVELAILYAASGRLRAAGDILAKVRTVPERSRALVRNIRILAQGHP